jgi:hypothetical protein
MRRKALALNDGLCASQLLKKPVYGRAGTGNVFPTGGEEWTVSEFTPQNQFASNTPERHNKARAL